MTVDMGSGKPSIVLVRYGLAFAVLVQREYRLPRRAIGRFVCGKENEKRSGSILRTTACNGVSRACVLYR